MNKKLLLATTSLSVSLFLAACSNGSEYDSLIKKADEAMVNLEIDEAIGYYEEILKLDPKEFEYGIGRQAIVEELLDSASVLKDQMARLQEITDEAKAVSENVEFTIENIDSIAEVYSQIDFSLSELENYPTTQMYKDLSDLNNHFIKETETNIINPLIADIDEKMSSADYFGAKQSVDKLSSIQGAFYNLVSADVVSGYYSTIDSEIERYYILPRTYTKRDLVLFEDKNAGKITFLGEGIADGDVVAYFKLEGGMELSIDAIQLDSRFIFSDGVDYTTSYYSVDRYKDYTILSTELTSNLQAEVARYDFKLNFLKQEEYKSTILKTVDGEDQLPAILKVEDEKTIETAMGFEDDDKKIEITQMIVDSGYIKLQGTLTAKKDLNDYRWDANLVVPNTKNRLNWSTDEDYFAGIPKAFEIDYNLSSTLTTEAPVAYFHLGGQSYAIDLSTGEEVKGFQKLLINEATFLPEDTSHWSSISSLTDDKLLYSDASGKKYSNVLSTSSTYRTAEGDGPKWYYLLHQKYTTIKLDVGIDAKTSGPGYGTTKVSFIGDGNVLKTVDLKSGSPTTSVELNISNVNKFEVVMEQTEGNDGYQTIFLGNGYLTAK